MVPPLSQNTMHGTHGCIIGSEAMKTTNTGTNIPILPDVSRQISNRQKCSFDEGVLWTAVQPIPLSFNIGARVEHFYLEGVSGWASVLIANHLKLPLELVSRLMWFGACYSCPVVPAPPPKSSDLVDTKTKTKILAWRAAGIAKHGKDVSP